MINVVCLKVGSKYPARYVNQLYKMCRRHLTTPFEFFCYTDDASELVSAVNVIPFIDQNIDVIVFNKLFLFSENFSSFIPERETIFFDLDVVIKGNIDGIVNYNFFPTNTLFVIEARWRTCHEFIPPKLHHPINSSCMKWHPLFVKNIWKHFQSNPEYFLNKYKNGMDGFLFYEQDILKCDVRFFPQHCFFSYRAGVDRIQQYRHFPDNGAYAPKMMESIISRIPVALFNHNATDQEYQNYYNKFYAV